MDVGPQKPETTGGGSSHDDPWLLARDLGLTLHMRPREGIYARGKHIWYDGRVSLPRQRAMLLTVIKRLHGRLKPLRKAREQRGRGAAA